MPNQETNKAFDLDGAESWTKYYMIKTLRSLNQAYEKQKGYVQELATKYSQLQKEITDVKIAFADNAYKMISSSATKQSYASVAGGSHQEGKAILIAEATKPIDIGMMAGQPPRF